MVVLEENDYCNAVAFAKAVVRVILSVILPDVNTKDYICLLRPK